MNPRIDFTNKYSATLLSSGQSDVSFAAPVKSMYMSFKNAISAFPEIYGNGRSELK
jgi:hypothetical protein